jgi:hydrogenase maturation factor
MNNDINHKLIHDETVEFSQFIWKQLYYSLFENQSSDSKEPPLSWKYECEMLLALQFVPNGFNHCYYNSSATNVVLSNNNRTLNTFEETWCTVVTNQIVDLRNKIGKQVIWEVTLDRFNTEEPVPNYLAVHVGFAYSLEAKVEASPTLIAYANNKQEIGLACGNRRVYYGGGVDTLGDNLRVFPDERLKDGSVIRIEITVTSDETFDVEFVEDNGRFPEKNIMRNVNGSFLLPCCSMYSNQTLSIRRIQ